MQTVAQPPMPGAPYKSPSRSRRFSPLFLIGVIVTLVIVVGAGIFLVARSRMDSHAATAMPNPSCSLRVPNDPLTARGLATPYQLSATDAGQGLCNENNAAQSAFVQAVIFDPATNTLSAYEPLVVDKGTKPAAAPVAPKLPRGSVVALWFGFNGTTLHLTGGTRDGRCVNGSRGSDFGQFAYCNAPDFFQVVNRAIRAKRVTVPAIGTTTADGKPCLTTRDFALVDMDQSDNVQTQYLVTANGQTAQLSAANQAALQGATTIGNPSDNALLSRIMDPTLGCKAWAIPDLANNGTMVSTLATDELQAAANQLAPVALVPAGDPMVLVNNNTNLSKTNLYRVGVDQPPARSLNGASTAMYCTNLINTGIPRLQANMQILSNAASPDAGAANSLFTFLANRLSQTLGAGGINCVGLLNIQNPITLTTDGNGVVTAATLTPAATGTGTGTAVATGTAAATSTVIATAVATGTPAATAVATGTPAGTGTTTTPNCNINGTAVAGCVGTTTINGQTCTVAFANNTVTVTCPKPQGGRH
jgi:hypothetical protein